MYVNVYSYNICTRVCNCSLGKLMSTWQPSKWKADLMYVHTTAAQHKNHLTAQMWVLVLELCNWRKINYQGSESISHGFSITLRMVAMKQPQLWNMLQRGLRKQEPFWGFISMNCPQHRLNFSMMAHDSIWPFLWRATPLSRERERQREKQEVAKNSP